MPKIKLPFGTPLECQQHIREWPDSIAHKFMLQLSLTHLTAPILLKKYIEK